MSRFEGMTGHYFEKWSLGECLAKHQRYLMFREAMRVVKANQPKAVPEQASLLRDAVSREVGGNVRFYTAVGSTLDIKHGIDGFFEFAGIVVAIDVTLNREKDVGKADIVVRGEDLDDLSSLAHHIVSEMLTKFKRKEAR